MFTPQKVTGRYYQVYLSSDPAYAIRYFCQNVCDYLVAVVVTRI